MILRVNLSIIKCKSIYKFIMFLVIEHSFLPLRSTYRIAGLTVSFHGFYFSIFFKLTVVCFRMTEISFMNLFLF